MSMMRRLRFFLFRGERVYVPSHVNFVSPKFRDTTPPFELRSCFCLRLSRFCGSPGRRDVRVVYAHIPLTSPAPHSTKV